MTKGDVIQFFKNYVQRNEILVNQITKPAATAKIMASAGDVASWYEAVQLYEVNRIDEAIEKFKASKQNAKMLMNTGCCYLRKNNLKGAEQMFCQAVKNDPHLALGFFVLGLTYYFQNMTDDALKSFEKSLVLLRGNKFVDYRQLGFNFQLYACEILTNIAGTHLRLNNIDKAKESIEQAYEKKVERKHERIQYDVSRVQSKNPKVDLFYPPKSELFRPSKASVANIKKKDYLGESKVISTDSEEDCYACFSGIKDKVIEQKKQEMIREKSPQFQRKDNIIELPKPAPKVLALPKSLNQERRSMVPKLQLPQLILDVPADSAPRSKSVGARPSKPLPTLLVPTKSLPKVVIDENNNNGVVEVKQLTQVKDERINAANFVEIEIQYSFIKKVRLPRSFSMDQLQAAARQQAVPKDFDFRTIDALGRQFELDDEKVKNVQRKVFCFQSETSSS